MSKIDIKTAGSGTVVAGDYGNIRTAGSCRVVGDITCDSMHTAGSCHADASIKCAGEIKTAGSCRIGGNVETALMSTSGSCHVDGDLTADSLKTAGSCHVGGNINSKVEVRTAGSVHVGKSIHAEKLLCDGSLHVGGDCEAEEIRICNPDIKGMLNGGSIEIMLNQNSRESFVDSIGCGSIIVDVDTGIKGNGHFFFKKSAYGMLTTNLIEADDAKLAHVRANRVRCKTAVIAPRCEIAILEYSESVEISEEAKVGELVKI